MSENNLAELDNCELIELLATLEGMNDSLKEQEELLKEVGNNAHKL